MTTFVIHKEPEAPRIITMGQAAKVIAPEVKQKSGRVKKMAEEKKLGHETGVEKVSQERADKQGPVGTSNQPPAREPGEEVKIGGDKEEKE